MNENTNTLPQATTVFLAPEGIPMTTSKAVAETFEKEHRNVLRDIDALLAHGSILSGEYFQEVSTPHPTVPGRFDRSFNMTRDGFSLLAMGFTGEKALGFKLAFIKRFNEMEKFLRIAAPQEAQATHGDPEDVLSPDQRFALLVIRENRDALLGSLRDVVAALAPSKGSYEPHISQGPKWGPQEATITPGVSRMVTVKQLMQELPQSYRWADPRKIGKYLTQYARRNGLPIHTKEGSAGRYGYEWAKACLDKPQAIQWFQYAGTQNH